MELMLLIAGLVAWAVLLQLLIRWSCGPDELDKITHVDTGRVTELDEFGRPVQTYRVEDWKHDR